MLLLLYPANFLTGDPRGLLLVMAEAAAARWPLELVDLDTGFLTGEQRRWSETAPRTGPEAATAAPTPAPAPAPGLGPSSLDDSDIS